MKVVKNFGKEINVSKNEGGVNMLNNRITFPKAIAESLTEEMFESEVNAKLLSEGFTQEQMNVFKSISIPMIEKIVKQLQSDSAPIIANVIPEQITQGETAQDIVQPLFLYPDNKRKVLPDLVYLANLNFSGNTFVDLFGGSGAVAVNSRAEKIILNVENPFLAGIYKALSKTEPREAWAWVRSVVVGYDLFSGDKEKFKACKDNYNTSDFNTRINKKWYQGIALQLANCHNGDYFKFSEWQYKIIGPVGRPLDIEKVENERFMPFASRLYTSNIRIRTQEYDTILNYAKKEDNDVFLYADPSCLRVWSKAKLYKFLDKCAWYGIPWMFSNAMGNDGKADEILIDWLKKHQQDYQIYYLNQNPQNRSPKRGNKGKTTDIAVIYNPHRKVA